MAENTKTNQPDKLLRIAGVLEMFAISKSTLYREIDNGNLPKPTKWGRRSCWSQNELQEVINKRMGAT